MPRSPRADEAGGLYYALNWNYLEEVKKGKARKFAMICKGASVFSLVVSKKGNVEKYKKDAKEAGKGSLHHSAAWKVDSM